MKKILSLVLVVAVLLSMCVTVTALGEKVKLGNMSFNVADGFVKIEQVSDYIDFQHSSKEWQTISLTMIKDFLEGTDAKNIEDVDEELLEDLFDGAFNEENMSEQMTKSNGVKVYVTTSDKKTGMYKTAKSIPFYMYEINYTGYASGYESFYGHYIIAVFGYYDDMYMFEMDKKKGENEAREDFVEMLDSVSIEEPIKILVDNEYVYPDSEPQIINSRTLCPIRAVAEKLGYNVDWEGETRTAVIYNEKTSLRIKIGDNTIEKSIISYDKEVGMEVTKTEKITCDVPAQIINSRTYLPVRAVGEALGCDVDWDGDTRTVIIISK